MSDRRNLVVCIDGTGNEFGDDNSNVAKLCQTLVQDERQWLFYHPGVGTMGAPNAGGRLAREWTKIKGLAFGAGLLDLTGDAYRFLMNAYAEGDHIYLFGFSRGAYAARALSGMLHMYGLLHRGNEGQIRYVTHMFAERTRARGRFAEKIEVAAAFRQTFGREIAIHFCGLWDTVSSVGWIYDPLKLPYTAVNPILSRGRHAVSIDERRCFFRDNLWGPSLPGQDLRQVWFAGVHSDVGGSYPEPESGLSKLALRWMLREAAAAGLRIDAERAGIVLGEVPAAGGDWVRPDPGAMMHQSLQGWWWALEFLPHRYYDRRARAERWRIPLGARRVIPPASEIHDSVRERMRLPQCDYHPTLPADVRWVSDRGPIIAAAL